MNSVQASKKRYKCDICGKSFPNVGNCNRHKKNVHIESNTSTSKTQDEQKYLCGVCKKAFQFPSGRRKHEMKQHNIHPQFKQDLICSECNEYFHSVQKIMNHFSAAHPDIIICTEEKEFDSVEDFKSWKLNMEKETLSLYISKKKYKTKDGVVENYLCHRSGNFVSRSTGKRHLKVGGSNKVGFFCPASIKVQILHGGKVSLTFVPTHIGHHCDVGRLRLTKPEKKEIAGLMHAGVPMSSIMHKIAKTPSKRLAATTMQDLRNIAASYGVNLDCIRSNVDVLSVDSWVKEMQANKNNPILFYKQTGQVSEEYPNFATESFVLAFMNEAQEEIFKIYGGEVVSIDSTHGTNKYDIQLTSIVVKDDSGEGLPVAFLWTNRQHEEVFTCFFQSIKKNVGIVNVKTFMTGDYPAFYNAWTTVFPPAQFQLLCISHVKCAWRKSLSSGQYRVLDGQKRDSMNKELESLCTELDVKTFQHLMEIRTSKWMEDSETKPFAQYFMTNYANRAHMWAACHREDARMNTNMTIEKWHKDLKYDSDLKGKCGGQLDKAIYNLIRSLQVKIMSCLSSLQRGELTAKIKATGAKHKLAEDAKNNIQVYKQNDSLWVVPSFTNFGDIYIVEKMDLVSRHKCRVECEKCHICTYDYRCSCSDSAIKYNVCKHIHLVCLQGILSDESDDASLQSDAVSINTTDEETEQEKAALTKEIRKDPIAGNGVEHLRQTAF